MNDPEGAWIFLSHSTKDWNEVRKVRNLLEEKGHRPLLFFLKCLTDESEVDGLIKREIEARTWFLLCDSENARTSKWVQNEVAYIKGLEGKVYEAIDLSDAVETQVQRINNLCKRATVFLSYSREDRPFAERLRNFLINNDYNVWIETALVPGSNWQQEIVRAIDEAVERGFVLVLLSPSSVRSQWVKYEIEYSLNKASKATHGANIIPIMIEDPQLTHGAMSQALQLLLPGIQWFDFSKGSFDANMENLISHMKSRAMD
ncbi:MAG: toll/interleukin-1 receptor domain-containing protein [Pyrinomonadaceae bacterium]